MSWLPWLTAVSKHILESSHLVPHYAGFNAGLAHVNGERYTIVLSSSPPVLRPLVGSGCSVIDLSDGVVPLDLEGRPLGAMTPDCLGYSAPELGQSAFCY